MRKAQRIPAASKLFLLAELETVAPPPWHVLPKLLILEAVDARRIPEMTPGSLPPLVAAREGGVVLFDHEKYVG